MRIVLIVYLSLFIGCANLKTPFDKTEMVMLGYDTLFHATDWYTTDRLMSIGYTEYNSVISEKDSTFVGVYFVSTWLLKVGIARLLPHKYRKVWLGVGVIGGATCTINNLMLDGVGF